ncbi:radical SAM protein [bacterium]|nr:radical SAM protein [bacterium]
MTTNISKKVFGPVPSRRLGRSCGINIIPAKICSYSCVYCQIGKTTHLQTDRGSFFPPDEILNEVGNTLEKARTKGIDVDYLTFVANGEPTLDSNLGHMLDDAKTLGVKTALISNASLIWDSNVQEICRKADWVSLKIDAVQEKIWKRINRPHKTLELKLILDGILEFARGFEGNLVTETMLVEGVNDYDSHLLGLAEYLNTLQPDIAYLSIPIRPPTVKSVRSPSEEIINKAYQIISSRIRIAECLTAYEGNYFDRTGGVEENILNITSVHPMREDAIREFLRQGDADWLIIEELIKQKKLIKTFYNNRNYYIRSSPKGLDRE